MKRKINGPTKLTIVRMIMVIPMMLCYGADAPGAKWCTLALFVIAATTDHVDGHWSRSTGQVTDLGALLDPIADKILTAGVFICFSTSRLGFIIVFAVIVVRDTIVNILRGKAKQRGITISASGLGKIKTATQMGGIGLILFGRALPMITEGLVSGISCFVGGLGTLLFMISFVLTIISGIDYIIKYRGLKFQEQEERS